MHLPQTARDLSLCLFAWLGGVAYAEGLWWAWALALIFTLALILRTRTEG